MKNVFVETKWKTNKKENKSFYEIEMKELKGRKNEKKTMKKIQKNIR
jgi:hypothetical protein